MNFSISEILVILLIALLVIKPDQLPDVAFNLGRFAKSIRQLFAKVKDEMGDFMDSVEKTGLDRRSQQKVTLPLPTPPVSSEEKATDERK